MNSDSTVSADKSSADAEGMVEPSLSRPDNAGHTGAPSESPDPDSGNERPASESGASLLADAVNTPAGAMQHPPNEESASTPAASPAEPGAESVTATAATPNETAGATGPVASDPAVPPTSGAERPVAAAPGKRKLRLNPTVGTEAKPVPALRGAASEPAGAISAPDHAGPGPAAPDDDGGEADNQVAAIAPEPPRPPLRAAAPVEVPGSDALDAEMEAEIAAAMEAGAIGSGGGGDAAAEAEAGAAESPADDAFAPPGEDDLAEGTKLKGVIQSIHEDNVFLDFGLRQSGVVSKRQFGAKQEPKVGERIDVVVSKVDEDEGLIVCRLPRGAARISGDWSAVSVGQTVECMVNKTNKGGLEVAVSSLRGFMPASQVDLGYVSDLAPFVGQKLLARVTEVNPGRRRLVLSRRAILAEERAEAEAELLSRIEIGQTCTGRVRTIKDYGAFVDLGGVDGFLHIGQMSWTRIEHPSELLSEGQDIEVKVLTIEPDKKDPEKKRIGLGMRQLAANPWASAEDKFPKGSTQTGRVTRTETYGAFIELEPGVEGLVHISELDHQRVKRVTEVLNVGQQTDVQVLEVDRKRKRISLSVKALRAAPEAATVSDEDLAPGGGTPYERKRKDDLKGGIGGSAPGGLFGNPGDYS